MPKKLRPKVTVQKWLKLARSKRVQKQVKSDRFLSVYPILIKDARNRRRVSWADAVALLHMVYAWMPTMLRTEIVGSLGAADRSTTVKILNATKAGKLLSASEIQFLMRFSNKSVVGASKLLHLLNPKKYPIWDARVARCFFWKKVAHSTLNRADRYCEYQSQVLEWSRDDRVRRACKRLKNLDRRMASVSFVRLIEVVMFRST